MTVKINAASISNDSSNGDNFVTFEKVHDDELQKKTPKELKRLILNCLPLKFAIKLS